MKRSKSVNAENSENDGILKNYMKALGEKNVLKQSNSQLFEITSKADNRNNIQKFTVLSEIPDKTHQTEIKEQNLSDNGCDQTVDENVEKSESPTKPSEDIRPVKLRIEEILKQSKDKSSKEKHKLRMELKRLLAEAHSSDTNMFTLYLSGHYSNEDLEENRLDLLQFVDRDRYSFIKSANKLLPANKQYNFYVIHSEFKLEFTTDGSDAFSHEYGVDASDASDWMKYNFQSDFEYSYEKQSDISRTSDNEFSSWELTSKQEDVVGFYGENGVEIVGPLEKVKVKSLTDFLDVADKGETTWKKKKHTVINEAQRTWCAASKTTIYHKHFLLFVPASKQNELLIKFDLNAAVRRLNEASRKTDIKALSEKLEQIFSAMKKHSFPPSFRLTELGGLLELLVKCKNNQLAQDFFTSVLIKFKIKSFPVKQLANFVKHYGVDMLKNASWNLFGVCYYSDYGSIDNRFQNAQKLAGKLLIIRENGKQLCHGFLVDFLKHNLTCHDELIKWFNYTCSCRSFCDLIYILVEIDAEDLLNSVADTIVKYATAQHADYYRMLEALSERIDFLRTSHAVYMLFKHKVDWLEKKIQTNKEFTWSMPLAKVPGHPAVEEFLHGNTVNMCYNNFKSRKEANSFKDKFINIEYESDAAEQKGYSADMQIKGTKNAFVFIVKTKAYHKHQLEALDKYKKEQDKLKSIIVKFNKIV